MSTSLLGVVAVAIPLVVVAAVLAVAILADATRSSARVRIALSVVGLTSWFVVFVLHLRAGGSWVMPATSLVLCAVLATFASSNARHRGAA